MAPHPPSSLSFFHLHTATRRGCSALRGTRVSPAMAPPTTPSFLRPPPLHHHPHPRVRLPPPPASFRVSEILGGRGLCNGEVGVLKELSSSRPPSTTTASPDSPATDASPGEAAPPAVNPDAFEKEMMGLTGGFPGGEVGLKTFVAKNPPPPKPRRGRGKSKQQTGIAVSGPPRPPELPLFLPGMVVLVKNPNNAYHNYCGIVQRVTDGKVAVLFEGGNWDRLITFNLDELEGREKGPPMVNPKSVVLEALVAELGDDEEAAKEEKEEGAAAPA